MLSLYIHIPFCRRKCFYCSFAVAIAQDQHRDRYLECLRQEAMAYRNQKLATVYVGGGTPSLLNEKQIGRLVRIIHSVFDCSAVNEMTIEINPEDVDERKTQLLRREGFNRISLGIQTFQPSLLRILGRSHTSCQASQAFQGLRRAGFNNINVDMIFALPGQTQKQWQRDLDSVTSLEPEHISYYCLSIEEFSRYHVEGIRSVSEARQKRQYEQVCAVLAQKGYWQYEVSNFARPGKESRHNIHYWQGGNYIGLGLGAHSHHHGKRKWNVKRLWEYISKIEQGKDPIEGKETLSLARRLRETLVYGLRMVEGVDLEQLNQRFPRMLTSDLRQRIRNLVEEGLLETEGRRLRATSRGRLLLDDISVYLI